MTKIEIMDVLARMEGDEQKYAHKLLCRAFAGRPLYTAERLPKLVDMIKRKEVSEPKIRKNLMGRLNDKELVDEIMDMCSLGKIRLTDDRLWGIVSGFDGWFTLGDIVEKEKRLATADTSVLVSMLDDLCMEGSLKDRFNRDECVDEWMVTV